MRERKRDVGKEEKGSDYRAAHNMGGSVSPSVRDVSRLVLFAWRVYVDTPCVHKDVGLVNMNTDLGLKVKCKAFFDK